MLAILATLAPALAGAVEIDSFQAAQGVSGSYVNVFPSYLFAPSGTIASARSMQAATNLRSSVVSLGISGGTLFFGLSGSPDQGSGSVGWYLPAAFDITEGGAVSAVSIDVLQVTLDVTVTLQLNSPLGSTFVATHPTGPGVYLVPLSAFTDANGGSPNPVDLSAVDQISLSFGSFANSPGSIVIGAPFATVPEPSAGVLALVALAGLAGSTRAMKLHAATPPS